MDSIARTLKFFKAIFTDAALAFSHGPPAAPAYQRVMLVNRRSGVVSILAVA
ncbi:MAG: hypothetical protein V3R81_15410 [Gammaproteobacteria bacterium]